MLTVSSMKVYCSGVEAGAFLHHKRNFDYERLEMQYAYKCLAANEFLKLMGANDLIANANVTNVPNMIAPMVG